MVACERCSLDGSRTTGRARAKLLADLRCSSCAPRKKYPWCVPRLHGSRYSLRQGQPIGLALGVSREMTPNVAATPALGQRKRRCYGVRRGTFRVLLDGKDVGSVDMHGTVGVPVEPGLIAIGRLVIEEYGDPRLAVIIDRFREERGIHRDNAVLDHWIIPAFGNRPLSSITPNDVKGFVSSMDKAGLAPRTVRTNFGVLRALLNAAVVDRKIAMSPCLGIRLPEIRKTPKPIASVDDVVRLAEAVPSEYAPAIYLGALGLRMQEVCGLKVKGIDFLRRTLTVELTVNEVEGKVVYGEGKTLSASANLSSSQLDY